MIEHFLRKLGFQEATKRIFTKHYPMHDNYTVTVNLKEGKIHYRDDDTTTLKRKKDGKIQLGDTTSSHFNPKHSANEQESFVVLEAVDALLEKGYAPQDLHLERRWKVGHGASGGKADINVYKNDKTFIIIECKTAGSEFEKEKKRLLTHGGQLFTYLNQDANAEYLVLYASYYEAEDDQIVRENLIVKIQDNPDIVRACKESDETALCSYKEAKNKEEFFSIWKNFYGNYLYRYGIFEEDVSAYCVELKPLKKKDLKPLTTSKGLFNKFAEILRHNNISDNANAFNKMLSLILCKIVDEDEKRNEDVLDFQIIEGLSDEQHIDKLQRLYKDGMAKFLGIKDFVYHSDEEIEERIKDFPKRTPLEEIVRFFKDIKYYTDKTFAFKEVYNRKLFQENAQILKEVVELIQFYKFKNTRKNQILGDFFELLLNHGVKQSEGQFFTPLPIAKYMVQAIDLEDLQTKKERTTPDFPLLKTLDYACGAGHFLIEAIEKIDEINRKKGLGFDVDTWTKQYIYGIEKDYRLARTSKIACFLNGDGEANIIYGDGLKKHPELEEDYQKFDLILTNPPYSVKQFKNYVELDPAEYELFDELSEKASEIEVLFIERAKQALRPGGRAGIILPSSILSNSGIYAKAREVILKYFKLKAITELGSKTFIATGTNTVILFLERREDKYPIDYKRVADEIYGGYTFYDNDYIRSKSLLDRFIAYRKLPDYHDFLRDGTVSDKLAQTEVFEAYRTWFYNSTAVKNLQKKKSFKTKSPQEQADHLHTLYVQTIKAKEKEKFYYFLLTYNQHTVVVKSPTATAEQKAFLGYEFNKKRGFEGIEVYTDASGKPTTKLYDAETDNPAKADYYVRRAFRDEAFEIDDQAKDFVKHVALVDMLDFDKTDFEKIIHTNTETKITVQSRWPLVKLGEHYEVISGQSPNSDFYNNQKVGIPFYQGKKDFGKKYLQQPNIWTTEVTKESIRNDILMSVRAPVGSVNINPFEKICIGRGLCAIRGKDYTSNYYLFEFLNHNKHLIKGKQGVGFDSISRGEIKNLKIPLPPKEIQEKIVKEIEALEGREETLQKSIKQKEKEINNIIDKIFKVKYEKKKLSDVTTIQSGGTPNTKVKKYWENGTINWATLTDVKNKYLYETKRKITKLGLENSSAKLLPINTVLFSSRATIGEVSIAKVETATNQGFKNFICNKNELLYEFLYYVLKHEAKEIEKLGRGATYLEISTSKIANFKIPVPPLSDQEDIVKRITAIEDEINRLKAELADVSDKKEKVLERYLF